MHTVIYRLEEKDDDAIADLIRRGFRWLSSFNRAVHVLRKDNHPIYNYSFVATQNAQIIGSVRSTYVLLPTGKKIPLLGPIVVREDFRGLKISKTLVQKALSKIKKNESGVLVIGKAPYFSPYGFDSQCIENLQLTGNVDPFSLLGLEIEKGIFSNEKGSVRACP